MKKLLVVVDMQNDFVTGALANEEAQKMVPRLVDYIKHFDGDVIYTRDTHQTDYMNTQEGKKLPVPHCIEGTEGWQIIPELDTENHLIFDKPTFGSIELGEWLAAHTGPKISSNKYKVYDEIYFCGVCTGICVISNVAITKAYCPETTIKVIDTLCACVTPESHRTAINAMKTFQVDIVNEIIKIF